MERKEAIEVIKKNWPDSSFTMLREALETLVPELAEGEDVRIRKGLIAIITDFESLYLQENYSLSKEDILAWLEKLEIKKHDVCDTCDEKASCVNPCPIKLVEQNPTDKIEPKFKVGDVVTNKKSKDTVKIVQILHDSYCYSGWDGAATVHSDFSISEQDDWELVEQKPAWSEEGEKVIHCLEYTVKHFYEDEDTVKWCCDWLKSLKPQNRWKPSDEQIEALDFAIDCIVWEEFCVKRKVLKELLEQLRKL